jgi:hypothetical protein
MNHSHFTRGKVMKRFWHFTVAVVLGVASIGTLSAQQAAQPGNAVQQNPRRGPVPRHGPIRFPEQQQFAPRLPPGANQPQPQNNPNAGVLQAQGVNRFPGQQSNQAQNQQFLGTNRPAAAGINPNNQLDEFGANLIQANRVIAEENARRNGSNGLQDGSSPNGSDQLFASGPGFISSNLSSGYGSTSIEEGILSGEARYMQGAGEYNRNSAEAVKTLEQARALYLENARTRLKTYFELKDLNAKYRSARAPLPVSKEKLDEWNRQDQPDRLTRSEYNSDTGRIQWPSVLMTAAFDADRMELEAIFARRTANEFGPKSEFFRAVHQETTMMQNVLKAHLRSEERFFTDEEYMAAKNFLESLAHEARLPPDLDRLVAN